MTYQSETDTNAAVDDALKTYPLAEPPDTLVPAVMARIQTITPTPRFQLTWFDYAISLFGAGMVGVVFLLWRQFALPSPGQLQVQIWTIIQHPGLQYLWIALLGGMALTIIAVLIAMEIFSRLDFQPTTE